MRERRTIMYASGARAARGRGSVAVRVIFSGVYAWLVGQFSIIYFRGLGLRVMVWLRVRVSVVLWSQ